MLWLGTEPEAWITPALLGLEAMAFEAQELRAL
eukprot:CAMPEP_0197661168 /NCGR_PEP_ID=MMETSP1338-20131121/51295_1 /TAXON_ID=43686 ORGANISM="Pelagodinium beii, Strain RCC1491" /NCGR_SAMPLE_ID=MMETSP1338 /ASSEMBLY_ACC=CAM_ASM_000754 /LENGTH=32 /DNA_ID= /DNA_START= /DNA_END= /DNA_ORIENTATION=